MAPPPHFGIPLTRGRTRAKREKKNGKEAGAILVRGALTWASIFLRVDSRARRLIHNQTHSLS
eukprot:492516-Pyramimonas_sp.AAC.1